jgi:hypothetical protein
MKCACQKPPAASPAPPEVPPCHIKKTMHFYPGDFDAFWRRRWHRRPRHYKIRGSDDESEPLIHFDEFVNALKPRFKLAGFF